MKAPKNFYNTVDQSKLGIDELFDRVAEAEQDIAELEKIKPLFDFNQDGSVNGVNINRKAETGIGDYSVAIGQNSEASNTHSIAMGVSSKSSGFASVALGTANNTSGNKCYAVGDHITLSGSESCAMGIHLNSNGDDEILLGRYNAPTSTMLLILGNGSNDANRHNALTIDRDGNATFAGDLTISVNGTPTSLATFIQAVNAYMQSHP